MSNCYSFLSTSGRQRPWLRGLSMSVSGAALLLAAPIFAQEKTAQMTVPAELSAALGWETPKDSSHRYGGTSAFAVGSEPDKWPAARETSKSWAEQAPSLEEAPGEYFFRKLARIEALALGATDAAVLEELRVERKTLGESLRVFRGVKPDGRNDWRRRSLVDALKETDKALGKWLAESPADRVELFREELKANQPVSRAELAERYGGEERLAKLIELGKEYGRLESAHQEAYRLPPAERREASKKAMDAMTQFHMANADEQGFMTVRNDPDLAIEFGASPYSRFSVKVPADLVIWAGEEEAARLLGEAYALRSSVSLQSQSRTGVLARRLIIEGKIEPVAAPWSLVGWPDDAVTEDAAAELVKFYDVLKPRFDFDGGASMDWTQKEAMASFALALAAAGRMDEAVALAGAAEGRVGLPYRARVTPGIADAAWDLMLRLSDSLEAQGKDPWPNLQRLAQVGSRRAELVTLAEKKLAGAEAGSAKARLWRERQGWALIAIGKIDEGLSLVNAALDEAYQEKPEAGVSPKWSDSVGKLFLVSKGLGKPELVAPWLERLAQEFKNPKADIWENETLVGTFAEAQIAAGNGAQLEEILRARTTPRAKVRQPLLLTLMGMQNEEHDSANYGPALIWRADVLGRLGNHAEVVALLSDSPLWAQADLSGYISDRASAGRSLPLIAAESLHAVGRADEAVAIVEAYLAANMGYDPAYALYTRLRGEQAVPFLEKLRAADRFEERPLIWLASLKLAAGDVDGAERTVKQAIAIDPSDGEQPKNDRMRAYAVLREVALKKGDAAQAEFLAGVLAAIRRSENADDLAEAGLVDRAIEEYQLALDSFSDAYCIQSRLARQLAEENRMDEAVEHYKRAFELMPDSFGRVESHCFGCERAFAGERAQDVAERVFTEMAGKPDAKPQVQYLLGYLRYEQDRWDEAAEHFINATNADPDYLNAWKKLAEVLPRTSRPRAEQDRVAFRLLELDPLGKHTYGTAAVRDLPALWANLEKAKNVLPPTPEKLFALGKKKPASDYSGMYHSPGSRVESVRERFDRHEVLSAISRALSASHGWTSHDE